jgi:O-antigen/teichoic acid export membrane protein
MPLLRRGWNSPTIMTWGQFGVRFGGFFLLLPLVLNHLSSAEIVVWFLFTSIVSMQWLLDMGFSATVSRSISHAMAGASAVGRTGAADWRPGDGSPNWLLAGEIVATSRTIYFWLALAVLVLIGAIGTLALAKPIAAASEPDSAWLAWLIVLATSPLGMWANVYTNYLEGTNRVALVRRWDMLLGLAGLASGILVLAMGGKLLSLVVATQAWAITRVLRDRALCHWLDQGRFESYKQLGYSKDVLRGLWPGTWRTGIGSVMSYGLIYGSNLLVAQLDNTAAVASYLVSMKLIESVVQFSMAPFYSQLPVMARKRAEGDIAGLVALARRGMVYAYWSFVLGFLFLALFADRLLLLIGSNASFAPPALWMLMGLAFFAHRFGAMHVQLYSTTNHVTSHIADFVSGIIFITVALALVGQIGLYALPIGMISGYLGFYAWYAAHQSYRSISARCLSFERNVAMPPLAVLLAYCVLTLAWQHFR